jgi:Rieske Fe-S protein
MNKETLEVQAYNGICEALGCFANASEVIFVKVGNQGELPLFLCKHCIRKFEDH